MGEGVWTKGETDGGCRKFLDTFVTNPQYVIELTDPDEERDDGLCTLVISLMQKHSGAVSSGEGISYLSIGFVIYRLKAGSELERMNKNFFKYSRSVGRSKTFIKEREVSERFRLPPARYLIVPSTFHPGFEGEFLLLTFTEKKANFVK